MKPITCSTCKENESLTITNECAECVKQSNWKDVVPMGNSCGKCKHEDLSTHESPCKECGGCRIYWEAKPEGECARMDKELEKLLRNGFEYDERHNSYNGTCRIVGIDWKDDLEQKLKDYFKTTNEVGITFPICNGLTPTEQSCTLKLLEEVGEVMELIGKKSKASGEVVGSFDAGDLIMEYMDVAQSAVTAIFVLCEKYGYELKIVAETHEQKLREKGYLK